MASAIFLDRDETLIEADSLPPPPPPANPGDVIDPARVKLLPTAKAACEALRAAGHRLVIYSSQGGVARGGGTMRDVEAVNDRVRELLGAGVIDSFYVCPFHPKGNVPYFTREHEWRKPGPGMIVAAARELGIELAGSWAVGDKVRDMDAAIGAGLDPARCLLLAPGSRTPDMAAAARVILEATSGTGRRLTTMRLTALQGTPLADARTRATVIAAAGAIAERTGIVLAGVQADDRSITVTLESDRLAGVGFLAELRRNTSAWYSARHPADSLWGEEVEGTGH